MHAGSPEKLFVWPKHRQDPWLFKCILKVREGTTSPRPGADPGGGL